MSSANDANIVKVQYNTDKNLNARRELHLKFSTNKYGWSKWLFDQYEFKPNFKVIEFGCGNGALWKDNLARIPGDIEIILSDFSEGMLTACKKGLEELKQIKDYKVIDIQNIPYEDNSFDVVIANHMLYHVPDREKAIKEVFRILKPGGRFYAATNGSGNLGGLKDIVVGFDSSVDYPTFNVTKEFGLENGGEQLSKYFHVTELRKYIDSLHVTEAKPLTDYVLSLEAHTNIAEVVSGKRIEEFYEYINNIIIEKGSIDMEKSAGVFVAEK